MNKQKAMMTLYKSTWIVLVVAVYFKNQETNFGMWFLTAIICLMIATFITMYLAAKESISSGYAKRNLALAVTLTLFGGLGFVIWPFLVNSEIEKLRGSESTTTNRPNEA
ncbi:MAG: hypothetical protein ACPGJU_01580 [Coraliomargarita sp.]